MKNSDDKDCGQDVINNLMTTWWQRVSWQDVIDNLRTMVPSGRSTAAVTNLGCPTFIKMININPLKQLVHSYFWVGLRLLQWLTSFFMYTVNIRHFQPSRPVAFRAMDSHLIWIPHLQRRRGQYFIIQTEYQTLKQNQQIMICSRTRNEQRTNKLLFVTHYVIFYVTHRTSHMKCKKAGHN